MSKMEAKKKIDPASLVRLGYLYVCAWVLFGVFLIGVIVVIAKVIHIDLGSNADLVLASLIGLVALAPIIVIWAVRLRCPNCDGFFTIQTTHPLRDNFKPFAGMTGWAATVARVVFQKRFVCMYCDFEVSLSR